MDEDQKDDLFSGAGGEARRFRFDERVVRVFPDMIRRSVPCYGQLVELTGLIGGRFVQPGTRCYDLGCSLGAVSLSLLDQVPGTSFEIVAVDNSPAMISAFAQHVQARPERERISPVCADLASVRIENASLVVLNLTLQFVPPARRLDLLTDIRRGLVPGGALILSEKIRAAGPEEERLLNDLHEDFKRANGYSELEISRKRAALERVLVPDSREQLLERLDEAGFPHRTCWFQCLNFISLMAWT